MKGVHRFLLTAIFICILAVQCGLASGFPPDDIASITRLSDAYNNFGFGLLENHFNEAPTDNFFFSPVSVGIALAMASSGAEGNTRDEIVNALHLGEMSDTQLDLLNESEIGALMKHNRRIVFDIGNGLWTTKAIKRAFITESKKYYGTDVGRIDIGDQSVGRRVNSWIKSRTHGRIANIDCGLDSQTDAIILNVVYFKGHWI